MYTEQDLINHILFVQNEETTADITSQNPAVLQAKYHLYAMNKEFQGRGWWFNKEYQRKLLPDDQGIVFIPTETISFEVTPGVLHTLSPRGKTRYVKRGDKVYDSYEHTFNIGCSLCVDLVILLNVEDLPPAAAVYLKHLSGCTAFRASDGDLQVKRDMDRDRLDAYAALFAEELKVIGANALDSPGAQSLQMGFNSLPASNPRYPGGRNWTR